MRPASELDDCTTEESLFPADKSGNAGRRGSESGVETPSDGLKMLDFIGESSVLALTHSLLWRATLVSVLVSVVIQYATPDMPIP